MAHLLKNGEGRFFAATFTALESFGWVREPEEVVGAYRRWATTSSASRITSRPVRLADDRHTTLARRRLHHDRRGGVEFRSVGGASHLLGDGSRSARRLRHHRRTTMPRPYGVPGTWGLSWSCCTRGSTTSRSRRPKSCQDWTPSTRSRSTTTTWRPPCQPRPTEPTCSTDFWRVAAGCWSTPETTRTSATLRPLRRLG